MDDDILTLVPDEPARAPPGGTWTVAVVDDDPAVHDGTRYALAGYVLDGRGLEILSARSGREARALLAARRDVAVVLLDVVMEPGLGLSGDAERLREALDNLVSNAIKYSFPGGAITVRVFREAGPGGPEIVCAVADHGPGLSPEDATRVFGRFQRLSAKPTGGEGSTGLGLSIVRRIAELHGGRAVAASDGPGLGAVFSVRFPEERGE